jgi:hypothetical protein
MTLHLINLDCPSCGSAMRGEGFDTIFFCSHCGDAAVLAKGGLETIESSALLPAAGRSPQLWRPAWRLEVEVAVRDRELYGGRETPGWVGRRLFYVPAFDLPLEDLSRLVRALSGVEQTAAEVPREPVRGGTLSVEDAMTLVRHVLIGDEVRRSDSLASVTVDLEESSRGLVALPFEEDRGHLRCAVTGLSVRQANR